MALSCCRAALTADKLRLLCSVDSTGLLCKGSVLTSSCINSLSRGTRLHNRGREAAGSEEVCLDCDEGGGKNAAHGV